MKTLLTHGWFIGEDPAEQRIMKPYPPLGLMYLSAWLTREGLENRIFDSAFTEPGELFRYMESYKPGILGIHSTLGTRLNVLKILDHVRTRSSLDDLKIVVGGPDARAHAGGYLSRGADVVVPGEGEEALADLVRFFSGSAGGSRAEIPGIVFKNEAGEVVTTPARPLMDPDRLPLPARDQVNMEQYLKIWRKRHGFTSVTVSSSRGCPYSCSWCSKSVFGNSWRSRDPSDVVEELKFLSDLYHPDQFWFTDDVFTLRREWLEQLVFELESRQLKISFECITREDCLDEETILLLVRAGCRKVWIGAESGSQRVLDLMNRRTNIQRTITMMRALRKAHIETGSFLMLGYPGETWKDLLKTLSYVLRAHPGEITVTMSYPIEGTRFFEESRDTFLEPYRWDRFPEREIKIPRPYPRVVYKLVIKCLFLLQKF